jgi:hypothetical protein
MDSEHEPNASRGKVAKPSSTVGWFPVSKSDAATINEQCGESAATTKAVWLAFLQIGNDRAAKEFTLPLNVIKHVAGVSRSTTKKAIETLVALGFITKRENRVSGKKESDSNTYTLLRSVDIRLTGRSSNWASSATGSSKKAPTRGAKEENSLDVDGRAAEAAAHPQEQTETDGTW